MISQPEEITPKSVIELVTKECKRVIANISKKHGLDYDELLDENLPEKIRIHNMLIKRKSRRNLPMTEMCMGRKLDMQQCTRRRQDDGEFCASHNKKLKMGRIDQQFPNELLRGKRGRRKKQIVNIEHNDCISTYLEVINRQPFLVDSYNRVYYYNKNNPQDTCYMGNQNLDGTITFDSNYLKYYADKYKVNLNMPKYEVENEPKSNNGILDLISNFNKSKPNPNHNLLIEDDTDEELDYFDDELASDESDNGEHLDEDFDEHFDEHIDNENNIDSMSKQQSHQQLQQLPQLQLKKKEVKSQSTGKPKQQPSKQQSFKQQPSKQQPSKQQPSKQQSPKKEVKSQSIGKPKQHLKPKLQLKMNKNK
jgi:hypothetical protein